MSTKQLAMPAIHNFDFGADWPKESKWGWHKASEVLEVINNIRASKEQVPLTDIDISVKYKELAQDRSYRMLPILPYIRDYWMASEEGHLVELFQRDALAWFHFAVTESLYLPAKIGIKLIDAVKRG